MKKGVDISEHQGLIDFDRMKHDVDFIILRSSYAQKPDKQFKRNLAECERLGIPFGVYHYSYALTPDYAKKEADLVLSLIKGHEPVMGVWFDMEDADQYKQKHGMPSKAALTDMCVAFCDRAKVMGYESGVYASQSWFGPMLDDSRLQKYRHWVAQWAPKCTYPGVVDIWQYTNKAKAGGISRLDGNYAYTLPREATAPDEVTKVIKATLNGDPIRLTSIEYKGENFVRLRDLADRGLFTVDWDGINVIINH